MASAKPAPPTVDIGTPDFYWGTWGQGLLTEWWETSGDLIWPQSVITYGKMRHDPQLKAVLSAYLLPLLRSNWAIDPHGCRDEVAQLVADDLGLPILSADEKVGPARRRGVVWSRHIRQAAQSNVFGHMPFERRYELIGQRFRLASLGPRMPWTLATIRLNRDGTIEEITQTTQAEPIPASRLVWYGHEIEGSAWAGISALRPAFGAWLIKHEIWRVHATSIRRFGMGVPTVYAPAGATAGQVAEAQALASGMRAGDQTGAGLPQGFKFELSGMTGSVPDALAFVQYLDQQMSKMLLAGLIDLGQTSVGSRALGETFLDLFLLGLQATAEEIATTATSGWPGMPGIVTDLVDVNWGADEPAPRVVCTDVGEQHELTAQALFWLMSYGAITADPELEAFVRQQWHLPERDTTAPEVLPPPVKLPKGGELPAPSPAPGGTPVPGAPAPQAAPARPSRRAAAAANGLRRQLTKTEIRAGFDPVAVEREWQSVLDFVLAQWAPIYLAQRNALVDQVAAKVDNGKLDQLSNLSVDSKAGAKLLADAMASLAAQAVSRMIAEVASQGVTVDPAKVKVKTARLSKVASARAALAGAYVAQQAGQRALQVVAASSGTDAGDNVSAFVDGLSQTSLRDQLGAALSAAQNAGRVAVLDAVPSSAGTATYTASEILDGNTCDPCQEIDGETFATLDDAEAAYANGGYIDCDGGLRCRGTVMSTWGDEL